VHCNLATYGKERVRIGTSKRRADIAHHIIMQFTEKCCYRGEFRHPCSRDLKISSKTVNEDFYRISWEPAVSMHNGSEIDSRLQKFTNLTSRKNNFWNIKDKQYIYIYTIFIYTYYLYNRMCENFFIVYWVSKIGLYFTPLQIRKHYFRKRKKIIKYIIKCRRRSRAN